MADKYCLFLLLSSTGYGNQWLTEKLINNPSIKENFLVLRLNPPHVIYELKEIKAVDLPMLLFGDQVVIRGEEEVMQLMSKESELGGAPELELQASFNQQIMSKFLPILSRFEPPEEQELFDHSSNTIENLMLLITGSLLLGLPNLKTFIEENDLTIPEFPVELEVEDLDDNEPENVVDLDFNEVFLSNFWQFSLSPPKFASREWVDFLYELNSYGLPISVLVKALGWYFGRHAILRNDLKMLKQMMQVLPPSWGQFIDFNTSDEEIKGGIQLSFYFTNEYAWDLMFFAFFIKGALENIQHKKFVKYNIYYNAESKYFEFTGTL